MNIDWKEACLCSGYKSLKAAYVRDAAEARKRIKHSNYPMRSPQDLYKHFQETLANVYWVARQINKPFIEVINECEKNRDYWWINFYNSKDSLLRVMGASIKRSTKPLGIKGVRKYWRKSCLTKASQKRRMLHYLMQEQKEQKRLRFLQLQKL